MAIQALNSAATGLRALSTSIDVVANNLANAETNAFKRSRVNFEDLMYQMLKQPGMQNSAGDGLSPAGLFVGLGTRISNTQLDMTQGSFDTTNNQLDLGISGNGFFKVQLAPGIGGGAGYTRNGSFFVDLNGNLVLGMGQGYRLMPPITIPPGATDISISQDGMVAATLAGATTQKQIGQIQLVQFPNPQGLELLGGNIYIQTDASGNPVTGNPTENGNGQLLQGVLETSNVDPVTELVGLIQTQRAFELNSQSIQTADEALETIDNLRKS